MNRKREGRSGIINFEMINISKSTTNNKLILSVFFFVLLCFPVYAKTLTLSPINSFVLNEATPDISPTTLDSYVGAFESESQIYAVRSLFIFNLKELYSKHIVNVYLQLNIKQRKSFMNANDYLAEIYTIPQQINLDTLVEQPVWSNRDKFTDKLITSFILNGNNEYKITLSDVVKEWGLEPDINHGLLIKGLDDNDKQEYKSNTPNIKEIDRVYLVVEYEDSNECNRNNGE